MTKQTTKLYIAINPVFGPQFAFNAKDEAQAKSKITGYNRYHGFYGKDLYTTRETDTVQVGILTLAIQNDWVS